MSIVFFRAALGGLAGLVVFLVCEPMFPGRANDPRWQFVELLFVLLLGLCIGGALSYAQGAAQGSVRRRWQWALLGGFLGAVGSTLGARLGFGLQRFLFPGVDFSNPTGSSFIEQMMARMTGLAFLGLFIGLAVGMCGFTKRRMLVGTLGGLIAGTVAGLLFDPLSAALGPFILALKGMPSAPSPDNIPRIQGEIGAPGRAVLAILLGLGIGLFTAFLDLLTRSAWLRLQLGRNEGKEWALDAPQNFIGRNETAHVPLFGDMNIAPMHAMIQRQGTGYALFDGGSPIGTYVNHQRVQQTLLNDGDVIQIGPYILRFMMRAGAVARAQEPLRGQMAVPPPRASAPSQTMTVPSIQAMPPSGSAPAPSAIPVQGRGPAPISMLTVMDGPLAGQRFPVMDVLEVGRDAPVIPLSHDASLSRRHARFTLENGVVRVSDLGSTNGTYVNGTRVQEAMLRPGDLVRVGTTTIRVE